MKHFLYIFFFLIVASAAAQQDTLIAQRDLKVGLVLSGGGAKGLAHIGVLKQLDKAGVRVDYIGGTSMGAIIGALYASGYSGIQIDSIFNTIDFEILISDDVPRAAKTFYEKEDSEKYAVTLPFDDFKVSIPSAISKGQNIYNLLSRLLYHVKDVEDFNNLPIPFLCIATEVEKGTSTILNKGYLPRAITASGALPSLFSPVVVENSLYIDGGVVNNYPLDEVKAMGAEFIIGVDVQDTLRTKENLKTAIEVLSQINNYRTISNMVPKRKNTDLYINPNIDGFSVVSFKQGKQIIEVGEKAALEFKNKFIEIKNQQDVYKREDLNGTVPNSFYIDRVLVTGNKNYTSSYILGKLRLKTPSKISYPYLSEGLNNLSVTGNFDEIDYQLKETEKEGHYNLHVQVVESTSRTSLRLGAHYDDLYKSAALLNLTYKRLLTNNDIASIDFIVGDNLRYDFEYYIDKGYNWSIGVSSRLLYFEKNVGLDFIGGELEVPENFQLNRIGLEFEDITNQLVLQTVFKRIFQLGLGAEHKYLLYQSETIGLDENNEPKTIFENTNYYSTYGILRYDTLDDKFFPSSGLIFDGNFHWYLFANGSNEAFEPFSVAKARVGYAQRFTPRLSAFVATEGGMKIGSNTTNSLDFFLGGYGYRPTNNLVEFYGLEALELRGDTYLKSSIDIDYEFLKKNHLVFSANIANIGDNLFETGDWIRKIEHTGYAIGYGLETFLGPLEAKYTYSPERKQSEWQISAGFRF